jgi:hypothetical protein
MRMSMAGRVSTTGKLEMTIDSDKLMSIRRNLAKLRTEYVPGKDDSNPPSVKYLRSLQSAATDESHFVVLTTLLDSECRRFGLIDECDSLGRQMIGRFPEEPMPWIVFAAFLLHTKKNAEEARSVIETGVEKAIRRGKFIRHAYSTRARIARALQDFDLLEDSLKRLLLHDPAIGAEDIALEGDFLINLPPGAISDSVLERYRKLLERQHR